MDRKVINLVLEVGELLRKKKWTISVAESCTGGLLGSFLTSIPGSSDYFKGGIIAYSNEIKEKLLSVSSETLRKFGAVSEEVVKEMAFGVKRILRTEVGLSISGIAGPSGGTKEKPVGTVVLGVDIPGKTVTNIVHLKGERNKIRREASLKILEILKSLLEV
ncbi:MAG: CinA family protein [candidate division WOR-3 bacterium]